MEAGYAWHPIGLAFGAATVAGDEDAEPAPLRRGEVDVGTLDPSGPILRFGVSVLF